MLERDVAKALKQRIADLGGEYRRVEWTGRAGAPDILVLLPVKRRNRCTWLTCSDGQAEAHPFVETKATGEVPKPHQLREHERLRKAGFIVLVIDSLELIDWYFPLEAK